MEMDKRVGAGQRGIYREPEYLTWPLSYKNIMAL